MHREMIGHDVMIVYGGPAGKPCVIRLRQLAVGEVIEITICVLNEVSKIGAHIFSGAVLLPMELGELIPVCRGYGTPLKTPVHGESLKW